MSKRPDHAVKDISVFSKTFKLIGPPFLIKYIADELGIKRVDNIRTFEAKLNATKNSELRVNYLLVLFKIGAILQENIRSLETKKKVDRALLLSILNLNYFGHFDLEEIGRKDQTVHDAVYFAYHNTLTNALDLLEANVLETVLELNCMQLARKHYTKKESPNLE